MRAVALFSLLPRRGLPAYRAQQTTSSRTGNPEHCARTRQRLLAGDTATVARALSGTPKVAARLRQVRVGGKLHLELYNGHNCIGNSAHREGWGAPPHDCRLRHPACAPNIPACEELLPTEKHLSRCRVSPGTRRERADEGKLEGAALRVAVESMCVRLISSRLNY